MNRMMRSSGDRIIRPNPIRSAWPVSLRSPRLEGRTPAGRLQCKRWDRIHDHPLCGVELPILLREPSGAQETRTFARRAPETRLKPVDSHLLQYERIVFDGIFDRRDSRTLSSHAPSHGGRSRVGGAGVAALYNGLVRARLRTHEAWSAIDVQLQRRSSLIPNLVEVVKGHAGYEQETLTRVMKARGALGTAAGPRAAASANNDLSGALGRLIAGAGDAQLTW